jgi:hypothetical protein
MMYRQRLLTRVIQDIGKPDKTKVNLLDALYMIRAAWRDVKQTTISNCFSHCHFKQLVSDDVPNDAAADNSAVESSSSEQQREQPDVQARNIWDCLNAAGLGLPQGASVDDYMQVDNDVQTCQTLTDAELVAAVLKTDIATGSDDETDECSSEPAGVPSTAEARAAFSVLRRYIESFTTGSDVYDSVGVLSDFIDNRYLSDLVQQNITDFFKKQIE